jgi:hypothetical protein
MYIILFIGSEMSILPKEFYMIKNTYLKSYFCKASTGYHKGTRRFLKCIMLATPEDEMAETMSFASLTDAVAVAMEQWSTRRHAYIVVTVVKTQRIFCKHFNIAHHRKIPCHNTVQLWLENFRTDASALKKPPGSVCTA